MYDLFPLYALYEDGTEALIEQSTDLEELNFKDVTIALEIGPSELVTFSNWCIKQVALDNEQRTKHRENMLPEWRINQLLLQTDGQMCYEASKAILKFKSLKDVQA
jgi:hypothetical protein